MMEELVSWGLLGAAAGLGVALPLGAVGVMLLQQGMYGGLRSAFAGATAIGVVDTIYCAVAVFMGAVVAPVITAWGAAPIYISGAVIILLGVRQHVLSRRRTRAGSIVEMKSSSRSTFFTFLGLTAVNPLTVLYFFALAGAVKVTTAIPLAPVVFIASVGVASLAWQLLLAGVGSLLRGALPSRVVSLLNSIAVAIIILLGIGVIVSAAWGVL